MVCSQRTEIGVPGLHGVPAASHVKVEPRPAQDSAIILLQVAEELTVLAVHLNIRLATPRVALQVDWIFFAISNILAAACSIHCLFLP